MTDISQYSIGDYFQTPSGELHEVVSAHASGASRSVQRNDVVIDCGGAYWTSANTEWINPVNETHRPIWLINTPYGDYLSHVVRTRQGTYDWREVAEAELDVRDFSEGVGQGSAEADTRAMKIISHEWSGSDSGFANYVNGESLVDAQFRVLTVPSDYSSYPQRAGKEFNVLVAAGVAPTITDGASLESAETAGSIVIYGQHKTRFNVGGAGGKIIIPRPLRLNDTVQFDRSSIIFEGQGLTQAWPGQNISLPNKSDRTSAIIWEGPAGIPMISLDDTRGFGFRDVFIVGDDNNRPSAMIDVNLRNAGQGGNNLFHIKDSFLGRTVFDASGNEGGAMVGLLFRSGSPDYTNNDFMIVENVGIENCYDYGISIENAQGVFGHMKHVSIAQCHTGLKTNSHFQGFNFLFSDCRRCVEVGGPFIPHPDNATVPSGYPQPNVSFNGFSSERIGQIAWMRRGSKLRIKGGGYIQIPNNDLSLGIDWQRNKSYVPGDIILHRDPDEALANKRWLYQWQVDTAYTSKSDGVFDAVDKANLTRIGTLFDAMGGSLVTTALPSEIDLTSATMPFNEGCLVDWSESADFGVLEIDGPQLNFPSGFDNPKILVRAFSNASNENAPPIIRLTNLPVDSVGDGSASNIIESGLSFNRDCRIYDIDLEDGRKMRNALNWRRAGFRNRFGDSVAIAQSYAQEFIDVDRYDLLADKVFPGSDLSIEYDVGDITGTGLFPFYQGWRSIKATLTGNTFLLLNQQYPATAGVEITLKLTQDAVGGHTVTFHSSVLGSPPQPDPTPSASTVYRFFWDGSNYHW